MNKKCFMIFKSDMNNPEQSRFKSYVPPVHGDRLKHKYLQVYPFTGFRGIPPKKTREYCN